MPEAHYQKQTGAIFDLYFPAHAPRRSDRHYRLFDHARRRLIGSGVGCWICGIRDRLEAHHAQVEFAAAAGVDYAKLAADHPEYHLDSQEAFLAWVESEGNLMILCRQHHRGPLGVHTLPHPVWVLQKFWKDDLPAPVAAAEAKR